MRLTRSISPSKFSAGSKAKGATKINFTKQQTINKPTSSKSSGSFFAESFTAEPKFPARPGGNRLLSRFSPGLTPDPYNPGCGGGPKSITVLSNKHNLDSSTENLARQITTYDGVEVRLTNKSANHLTSKHAYTLGIDDPLQPNPNQKLTKYEQTRTRVNKENKEKFGDILEEILKNPNTEFFPNVNIRGTKSNGYYSDDYGESSFFIGIHNEGEFKDEIKKAQPISEIQFKKMREQNKIE